MIEHLINQTKLSMYAVAELQRSDDYDGYDDEGERRNYIECLQLEWAQRELGNAIAYLQEVQRIQGERK